MSLIGKPSIPSMAHFTETNSLLPERSEGDFLAFTLGEGVFAFPLLCVREVLKLPPICPVPHPPAGILGVFSLRGDIVTLFGLEEMLRIEESTPRDRGRIVLIDNGQERIGVFVDRVLSVFRFVSSEIEKPAEIIGSKKIYAGVARPQFRRLREGEDFHTDPEMVIILNPEVVR